MTTEAVVYDSSNRALSGVFEIQSDDFLAAEGFAKRQSVPCCIRWPRTEDDQAGYWSPCGACFLPYWYNRENGQAKEVALTLFQNPENPSHIHVFTCTAEMGKTAFRATLETAVDGEKGAYWRFLDALETAGAVQCTVRQTHLSFTGDPPPDDVGRAAAWGG